MNKLWVVLFVALTGSHLGYALPVRTSPETYPHDGSGSPLDGWSEGSLYTAVPALVLVIAAVGLLLGCTWCYRHKDCKPNEGADNQLFAASAPPEPRPETFPEQANNNISEDNNNGPISLREMQNIANNNAAAYIVSENEERNRGRESVVHFEPLPDIRPADPLERCVDWFGSEDFPRNQLQYLREIGRGWFGRIVEGEITEGGATATVAVKILSQHASLEDKARFLDEAKLYRDVRHDNVMRFVAKCLQEDPWILMFELCDMDLQQYLVVNRPKMAILNESGVPLQLMCDYAAGLAYLHSQGYHYGPLSSSDVLVRDANRPRGVLGRYGAAAAAPAAYTPNAEVCSLGTLIWEVCTWGAIPPQHPPPLPELPCPYRSHLYQVMQLCWQADPSSRPTAGQVHALIQHLLTSHSPDQLDDDGYGSHDFEDRWQRLKPNSIPKVDEHIAIVHAPSTSTAFTGSDDLQVQDNLSVGMDTAVSRSSSIMSDKDPLSVQIKSESLTNLHGSLEDVRNIYLTHNETAALECHQGNVSYEEKDQDRSDSSMDPWIKDIIAGSQDDVSYYKDVSDVIKNLDNILNSEKTSSSESSHQASPSRDNLSLDCKKEYNVPSSLVKSPGITNFQNILQMGFDSKDDEVEEDEDRDTIGTLSHSFERHSDTVSQNTLENLTPDTPMKDIYVFTQMESEAVPVVDKILSDNVVIEEPESQHQELPKEKVASSDSELLNEKSCVASVPSVSENDEQLTKIEDCRTPCDSKLEETVWTDTKTPETKSVDVVAFLEAERNASIQNTPIVIVITPDMVQTSEETEILDVRNIENLPENQVDMEYRAHSDDIVHLEDVHVQIVSNTEAEVTEHSESIQKEELKSKLINEIPDLIEEVIQTALQKIREPLEEVNDLNNTSITVLEEPVVPNLRDSKIEDLPVENQVVGTLENSVGQYVLHVNELGVFKAEVPVLNETSQSEAGNDMEGLYNNIPKEFTDKPAEFPKPLEASKEKEQNPSLEEALKFEEHYLEEKYSEDIDTSFEQDPTKSLVSTSDGSNNETVPISELVFPVEDTKSHSLEKELVNENIIIEKAEKLLDCAPMFSQTPEPVQSLEFEFDTLPKEQDFSSSEPKEHEVNEEIEIDSNEALHFNTNGQSNGSTVYMDLINNTNSELIKDVDNNVNVQFTTQITNSDDYVPQNESTVYLDLPSLIKYTDDFLNSERTVSSNDVEFKVSSSSTPKGNEGLDVIVEHIENSYISEGRTPETLKLEKRAEPMLSPCESPTKSHHTDTYDENSSVVLGPFENCATEYKTKPAELVDILKEELLAFSSNFSEINLETPSPLRDRNFLNEVPDVEHSDFNFDDIEVSEAKTEPKAMTGATDVVDGPQTAEKRVSPSTPPNSPGNFLAATSQEKYLVDIDINSHDSQEAGPSGENLQKGHIFNEMDLHITSKLAMAENENNLNIEYSGPLTEGLSEEGESMAGIVDVPEAYLAGNGSSVEDARETFSLDEESMKALRNELELKLPLAQVASIEPAEEAEWGSLPPPPELILSYPGALSPIAEETGPQLSAYHNDMHYTASSSESYPEPCTSDAEDGTQPPALTYSLHDHSPNNTYTLHRDHTTSRDMTMSADSLNASPMKKPDLSPIDDKTFTKHDDKPSPCERLSQVSPFLLSPTDTDLEHLEATGISTLSRTTPPTDARTSKPSEPLSKATSIDSWCSNDTLYNVEENFEDMVLDAVDFELEAEEKSDDTLTHHEDDKDLSHCSTYIVHDSKSEASETFSPDSITANDNYTYTKARAEAATNTPSATTNLNSEVNTQTKDLAYETLISGLPSYSNCTTEVASGMEDAWRIPELVRRSPMEDINITPPKLAEEEKQVESSPQLTTEPSVRKIDSVEIYCLHDNSVGSQDRSDAMDNLNLGLLVIGDSPKYNFQTPSVTSTPLVELVDNSDVEAITMQLPEPQADSLEINHLPNFQSFLQSAEIRPQDISSNASKSQETEILLDGESTMLSRNSNNLTVLEPTLTYSDFENSAHVKPQELNSTKSSQSVDSNNTEDFRQFESSVKYRPQDLSSVIDASSMLLQSERTFSELAMRTTFDETSQPSRENNEPTQSLDISPPIVTNLIESHGLANNEDRFNNCLDEEDTEQPHSIIITDLSNLTKESPNRTYDSHEAAHEMNSTYDSHVHKKDDSQNHSDTNGSLSDASRMNGVGNHPEATSKAKNDKSNGTEHKDVPNNEFPNGNSHVPDEETKCNGNNEKYATVNVINENFEELIESNVDDVDCKSNQQENGIDEQKPSDQSADSQNKTELNGFTSEMNDTENKMATEDFLQNEKRFCMLDSCLPMLSDIRFTGPGSEIMSTSFTQQSPTSPESGECERDNATDAADLVKEWDSDSDSHTSNSSSGEFIWKDGDGCETSVVPSSRFDHQQRGSPSGSAGASAGSGGSEGSEGSEGDEVEFVPSSWDCLAAPAKSSLRTLQTPGDGKKRVVFKRQKYHCVYEYPREATDVDPASPAYLPDLSTYCEWDAHAAAQAALGYGQLFPADMFPLRAVPLGPDYDEDFYISSSARPFESLGLMSSSSQFFPGLHKPALLPLPPTIDPDDFPPPPSPLAPLPLTTPSVDFTTPDSGVEDITPGNEELKKMPEVWRPADSTSSSESVSPSSPGEMLGGLRHTRDKLKLDLPPSPHIPSPRHNRVFNFVLDKPKRRVPDERPEAATPLVMTDETPIITSSLPLQDSEEPVPEPTFSTFGKCAGKVEPEQKIILNEVEEEVKEETKEPAKEGTAVDSGDEDSGIESSSKNTLEKNNTHNVS